MFSERSHLSTPHRAEPARLADMLIDFWGARPASYDLGLARTRGSPPGPFPHGEGDLLSFDGEHLVVLC